MSNNGAIATTTGDGIQAGCGEWAFNQSVAETFDRHVAKSVPYYLETQQLAVDVSDWFVHEGCTIYDIGCATGTTIFDLAVRHWNKGMQYIGVDNSEAMLNKARQRLGHVQRTKLICDDILELPMPEDLAMVYCLYTLQFIDPQRRLELCHKIHKSLSRRGGFVLVEKVLDHDPVMTDIYTQLHWSKKEAMGFDVTEIYGKAQSLRGVLVPFTTDENIQMLQEAGFSRVSVFFKWCNFIGLIAVK